MGSTWDFIRNVAWKDFKKLMSIIWGGLRSAGGFVFGRKKR